MEHVNWKKKQTNLYYNHGMESISAGSTLPNSSALPAVQVCRDRNTGVFHFPETLQCQQLPPTRIGSILTTKYEGFSHQQGLHQCGFVLPLDQQEQEENKQHDRVSAPM